MSAYLDASNGPPADDSMPSYEEAVAGGAQRNAVRTHSVSGSIQSLNLHDGTLPPSILRLKHLGRAICLNGPVTSIAISPKGYVATSQDNSGTALPSSTKIWDFPQKPGAVGARLVPSDISSDAPVVVFSPDGKLTAVVEKDAGWKREWRVKLRAGEEGRGVRCALNGVGHPAAFSPDGKKFAAADPLGVVVVFEAATSPPGMPPTKKVAGVMNHAAPTHVLFMPNGADLVTLSRDGTVRISEAKTGRTLRRMEVDGVVTGTGTGARALGASPDGRVVVSVWARAVYVWEHEAGRVSSWEMNKVRNNEGWPLAVSPDCRFLACRTEEGMDISDVYSGQVLAEVTTAVGIDGLVTAAAFSMDGKMMAVGRHSGVVDVWNLAPYEGL
ncbi:ribosome assembly protein 4 [Colletotrichum melonis]|uniref:Ribosome assembly protein 4 n=2 Tax=Colletotrichum acutatum species complex TaxID=2707335 RepID=A0AAI9UMN4_9PEZI|nr:ribosome assembly protein 4 [Colletotrichum tamarilloi]KAK1461327.1 ribosome assembly protein 4 [Colletotrichum melonis]KAK1486766.1 ribosome assembly protein 4 [Colletotrichum tamarilloi]